MNFLFRRHGTGLSGGPGGPGVSEVLEGGRNSSSTDRTDIIIFSEVCLSENVPPSVS